MILIAVLNNENMQAGCLDCGKLFCEPTIVLCLHVNGECILLENNQSSFFPELFNILNLNYFELPIFYEGINCNVIINKVFRVVIKKSAMCQLRYNIDQAKKCKNCCKLEYMEK